MLGSTLRLSQRESQELHARARSRVLRADDVRRARLISMLAEGHSWSVIQQALGCSSAYIARWQARCRAAAGGPVYPPSGAAGDEAHSSAGSPHSGLDPPRAD